jgi:hypothetical protein
MARRKPLVTLHLENISGKMLTNSWDLIAAHTEHRQGVYALYRKRKLHYVGLATNLAGRLKSHRRDHLKGSWDHFSVYLTIGDEHMRELEALLLRITKPSGNKVTGRFAKSQDLKPRLRQQYRARKKREEDEDFDGLGPGKRGEPRRKVVRKSKATGRRPKLAPYVDKAFNIKARAKGKTHRARVRWDGTIRFLGEVYNSPSLAGKAAIKRMVNGWTFWKYERSPGDWVPLEELRRHRRQR